MAVLDCHTLERGECVDIGNTKRGGVGSGLSGRSGEERLQLASLVLVLFLCEDCRASKHYSQNKKYAFHKKIVGFFR